MHSNFGKLLGFCMQYFFFQINGNSIAYTIEIHIKTCNKKITFLKFVIELHYTLKFVLKTNFILKFLFKNKFHTKTH